jgi:hypothetical protein
MPDPVKQPTVWEYLVMAGKLWGEEISGPILAFVSIVLIMAYARYADDADATAKLVKYSAWLTGAISILLIFVAQYKGWRNERDALNNEKVRSTGADIRGTIRSGYLDLRTFPNSNVAADWIALPDGCSVRFYIEAVNHNDWGSWFRPHETKLELHIGKSCFRGTWERVSPVLAVHDDDLRDKSLADLFDRLPPGGRALQHGAPWSGYVGFLIPDFDRRLLKDETEISAAVKIMIVDTLDKVHRIEGSNVKLLIGRLCLSTEIESPQ